MTRRSLALLFFTFLLAGPLPAEEPAPPEDTHQPTLHGLQLGMTAQEVLDRLGRMPDARQDADEEIVVFWQFENGDVLQVNFWKDHVAHLALKFAHPPPATDLWLVSLDSHGSSVYGGTASELTAADPRWRRDYKVTQTRDKNRNVWTRQIKTDAGYPVEIQFLSTSREKRGDRFWEFIEFKYVTLPKKARKDFLEAVLGGVRP